MAERDSVTARLQAIEATMSTVNATLDSLALEENIVFINSEGQSASREDALRNLDKFEAIVRKQHEHINALEQQLSTQSNNAQSNMQRLLAHMKKQLSAKDAEIAQLRADLNNKDISIAELRDRLNSQGQVIRENESAIADLGRRNSAQAEVLSKQSDIMNYGYVIIATKKELKSWGLLKRGKLNSDAVTNAPGVSRVDIRKWHEVSFTAHKPHILTSMPASSYELVENAKDSYTLRIKDATAFWGISKYLVIQTK